MEEIKLEEATYLGICKCCLKDGDFKSMWAEYSWEEEREVYGEMLKDSYNLDWQQPDESTEHIEQICETCIEKLRTAYYFKKQLLEAEQQLRNHFDNERKPMKYETNIIKAQVKEPVFDDDFEYEDVEFLEDEQEFFDSKLENNDQSINLSQFDEEYNQERRPGKRLKEEKKLDITKNYKQYLEYNIKKAVEAVRSKELTETEAALAFSVPKKILSDKILRSGRKLGQSVSEATPEPEDGEPNRKWPKRKKKSEITKNYRQYSEDDLRKAIEAVNNKELSQTEAALAFNIPKKTLSFKVRNSANKIEAPEATKAKNYKTQSKLVQEIMTIVTYTNVTPYKNGTTHFYCAYCGNEGPKFDDPEELRVHTRTQHATQRIKNIDQVMKQHWINEILKVDVENLYCTVCGVIISKWKDMFNHLKETHNLDFEEAYKRVIPYILKGEFICALCNESFANYHQLDTHMNSHYRNYICPECGDAFLSYYRYKYHFMSHNTGRFPCKLCGKNFTLDKYRKKHANIVHKQAAKVKCLYCPEKFFSEYFRQAHVLEKHKEMIKYITCDQCGKVFNWKRYYLVHLRKKHKNERNYHCPYCQMSFFTESELVNHVATHNSEKNHECKTCNNKYASKQTLQKHLRKCSIATITRSRSKWATKQTNTPTNG